MTQSELGWKKLWQEAISFIVTVGLLLGLAFLIIRPTFIEPFQIPSSSMVPTLQISDRILVNKLAYGLRVAFMTNTVADWKMPARGDVVVFTRPDEVGTPQDESKTNFIKRVIGLPGDKVEVRGTEVYINDALLSEPYARYSRGGLEVGN